MHTCVFAIKQIFQRAEIHIRTLNELQREHTKPSDIG